MRTSFSTRALWLLGIVAATFVATAPGLLRAETAGTSAQLGLVAEQPADGRFVKVANGYMVAYEETIPGTQVTFEMVPVPGGEFVIGSPAGEAERGGDEGPQVRVKVEPFWIGKCEVTWDEYRAYMAMYDAFKKLQLVAASRDAGNGNDDQWQLVKAHAWDGKLEDEWKVDAVTSATPLYDPSFTFGAGDQPNQPAVTMTQFAAKQYTRWLSGILGRDYRIPTEAEWEYAARAGTNTAYSFGGDPEELGDYAWFDDNADFQTHPVAEKQPNAWGIHDMHGNAAEWVLDEYRADTYAGLGEGTVEARIAVRWPTRVYPRVIRGGSWLDAAPALRSAARHKSEEQEWKLADPNIPLSPWWYTEEAATGVGMRVMRPLESMSADEKKRVWDPDVPDLQQDVRDRLREGRGALGVADEKLPAAVEAADAIGEES